MMRHTTDPKGNRSAAPRVRLLPAIFALAVTGSAVCPAVEVTYQYYRFSPKLNAPDTVTATQLSEFLFYRRGAEVSRAGVVVTGGGANTPESAEGAGKLIDGTVDTKWYSGGRDAVVFDFGAPTTIDSYNFATANDSLDRTPTQWLFEGSTDGTTWVTVDNRDLGANAVPPTYFTYRGIVFIGGGTPLPAITSFGTPTTEINSVGPILEAQPSIVKNTLASALKWNVTGTTTGIMLTPPGIPVIAADTLTPIVPPSNADTYYTLAATNTSGTASASHKLRAVPGTTKTTRYVKFTGTTLRGNGTLAQIGEMEFFDAAGTKLAVSSATNPGGDSGANAAETVASIIDNDYGTKWLNHNNRPIIFDFGTNVSIASYQITTGNDDGNRDAVRWILESSDDGVNYKLLEAVNNYPVPNERRALTGKLPLSGTTAQWTGSADTNWDNTTTNWANAGTTSPAIAYRDDEPVIFGDSGINRDIYVLAPVAPSFIEIDNSSAPYTFDGEAPITGLGGLVKRGSGEATFYSGNSFSGAVYNQGGKLILENSLALGARDTNNRLELGGGSTLDARVSLATQRRTLVLESGANIAVGDGSTLTKIGSFDFRGTLHKTGGGTLRLQGYTGSVAPAAEDIVVDGGTFEFNHNYYNSGGTPYPASSLDITVNALGRLVFAGNSPLGGFHTYTTMGYNQIKLVEGGVFEFTTNLNYIPSGRVGGQGRVVLQGGVMTGGGEFEPVVGSAAEQSTITALASTNPSQITGTGLVALNPGNLWFVTEPGSVLDISRKISGGYGFVKEGTGELIISGNENTYIGTGLVNLETPAIATRITAGTLTLANASGSATGTSPVTIAAGATLQGTGIATGVYTIAGSVAPGGSTPGTLTLGTTTLSGSYLAQIDGSSADKLVVNGDLDLTGATLSVAATGATAPIYVIATYTGNLTGSFTLPVTGLPSGYDLFVNTGAKQIEIKQAGATETYESWAASLSDPSADADEDNDGLLNGIEFVVGADPEVSDLTKAPTFVRNGSGDLVFTFLRTERSAYLNPVVEYSTTLAGTWTTFGAAVVAPPVGGVSTVTATLPASLAGPNGELFARLRVTVPVAP
ncbi:discoidin domain-containing protein [Luteolibacter sp. Populi]|uniref:discoidin domain-containing protein n=1 Tax=Luteolibacter sp. Populi TaxID=3230487 RepID=UPI00346610C8